MRGERGASRAPPIIPHDIKLLLTNPPKSVSSAAPRAGGVKK
jgi:hypothetical protein